MVVFTAIFETRDGSQKNIWGGGVISLYESLYYT